jgi:hypothetical protein
VLVNGRIAFNVLLVWLIGHALQTRWVERPTNEEAVAFLCLSRDYSVCKGGNLPKLWLLAGTPRAARWSRFRVSLQEMMEGM